MDDAITHNYTQLHTILKFGSFVVLLDPLKMFQNQMFDIIFMANQNLHNTFPVGSHINTMSITAISQIVMEPNRTCLLLTSLLLPIIIWLAEMLALLRKVHF